jgi:exocyst complex protein 7
LVEALEKLSIKGMQEYILFIKGDSEKHSNLPKDGTVHELTSNTMWFLEQLLEFPETVGRLQLFSESDFDEEDCRKAVGSYMIHTLNGLTMNLEQKSRTYESSVLAAIFLLNNYYFIQSTFIRRDEMLQLMKLALADIENYYITLIDNQRRAYQRG